MNRAFSKDQARRRGFDPNATSALRAVVECASACGDEVKRLLAQGADPDPKSGSGRLLERVVDNGRADLASVLLAAGAKAHPENGTPILVHAARRGGTASHVRLMVHTLLGGGARVDGASAERITPLIEAVRRGDGTWVQILLEAGAHPNQPIYSTNGGSHSWRGSVLHLAMDSPDRRGIVRALLAHGANPLRPDHRGQDAVDRARAWVGRGQQAPGVLEELQAAVLEQCLDKGAPTPKKPPAKARL